MIVKQSFGGLFRLPFTTLFVFSCISSSTLAYNVGPDIALKSISLSEPVKVGDNFNEWETPDFSPGERVYTKQVSFTGVRVDNFVLGLTARYHYYLNFSPDTARLYYLDKNDSLDTQKTTLNIDLSANQTLGSGYYFGYDYEFKGLKLQSKLSYLKLRQLTLGSIKGIYDPTPEVEENKTNFITDYAYTKDHILDREVDAETGSGWILDLRIRWDWKSHHLNLTLDEAYSRLNWKNAPASLIHGDMEAIGSSSGATVEFEEFYTEVNQRLPVHSHLSYENSILDTTNIGFAIEDIDTKSFYKAFVRWDLGQVGRLKLSKANMNKLWGIAWETDIFQLDFEADHFNYIKAHSFKLSFILDYRF